MPGSSRQTWGRWSRSISGDSSQRTCQYAVKRQQQQQKKIDSRQQQQQRNSKEHKQQTTNNKQTDSGQDTTDNEQLTTNNKQQSTRIDCRQRKVTYVRLNFMCCRCHPTVSCTKCADQEFHQSGPISSSQHHMLMRMRCPRVFGTSKLQQPNAVFTMYVWKIQAVPKSFGDDMENHDAVTAV